jgi:hypothetical protein
VSDGSDHSLSPGLAAPLCVFLTTPHRGKPLPTPELSIECILD